MQVVIVILAVVFAVFGALFLIPHNANAPNNTTQPEIILSVNSYGGLCANNATCSHITNIENDGTILIDDSVHGNSTQKLNNTELSKLSNLINSENFTALMSHPFTGQCPTAYDGEEFVYTFNTLKGNEIIDSCKVAINSTDALFTEINLILSKY